MTHWSQLNDITGGPGYGLLYRIMWRGVASASNTRLIGCPFIPYTCLFHLQPIVSSPYAQWTLLLTSIFPMALALFWSWWTAALQMGVILLPCRKMITAEQVAELLLEHLYKQFGLPDKFIFDRGHQFAACALWELLKLLNMTSKFNYPQLITLKLMELLNNWIKKLRPIFWYFVLLSLENGPRNCTLSNSPTIIDNMPTGNIHYLN